MLNAMTKDQFDAMKKDRDAKLGLYVSRQVNSVVQDGEFYAVIYDAKFEKDDAVVMRVVFRIAEPHQVSGLWFNK
jgi:thymidine phosphorylase